MDYNVFYIYCSFGFRELILIILKIDFCESRQQRVAKKIKKRLSILHRSASYIFISFGIIEFIMVTWKSTTA